MDVDGDRDAPSGTCSARSSPAILRFVARKLAGLAKHNEADPQPKTADHVMIDILGALIRAAFIARRPRHLRQPARRLQP
jgi:hypothetical protein